MIRNKIVYAIIFLLVLSCQKEETKTLIFKECKIEYSSYEIGYKELYEGHSIPNELLLESANRQLALCLCEKYLKHPDMETEAKIIEIYNTKEEYFRRNYLGEINFDTILKKRMDIFDPIILID